jgi:hypothetical protein
LLPAVALAGTDVIVSFERAPAVSVSVPNVVVPQVIPTMLFTDEQPIEPVDNGVVAVGRTCTLGRANVSFEPFARPEPVSVTVIDVPPAATVAVAPVMSAPLNVGVIVWAALNCQPDGGVSTRFVVGQAPTAPLPKSPRAPSATAMFGDSVTHVPAFAWSAVSVALPDVTVTFAAAICT